MPAEHIDPLCDPSTSESPVERFARALPLADTPGQTYVEHRGIPLAIADAAGMRFDADWNGRAAVLIGTTSEDGSLASVHGRYIDTLRGQDKMLTIGGAGGVCAVGNGWHGDPLILVEGVFDALSLATCGWSCIATIGRWAPWLPRVFAGRDVWLGFDANHPGDHEAARYAERLAESTVHRLLPPPHCKDWNTALVKRGRMTVTRWLRDQVTLHHDQTATSGR